MDFKTFLRTRTATWLLAVALAFVMVFSARILIQQYQVNKQITKLENQAEKIKKENEQLSSLIEYFNTPEYEEKQAREKLNLKKEGEVVVSLPTVNETESQNTEPKQISNAKLWFNYFFNQKGS